MLQDGALPVSLLANRVPVFPSYPSHTATNKRPDTVGQPSRTEIGVPNIPSLKKKAEETAPIKSTLRTLKEVGQQYPPVFYGSP